MRQPILGLKRLSHCLIVSLSHRGPGRDPDFFPRPTGDSLIVSLSHRGPGRDPVFFPPNWGLSHCLIVSPGSRRDPDFFPAQLGIVSLSHCLNRGSSPPRVYLYLNPRIGCLIVSLSQLGFLRSIPHRIASRASHRIASRASHRIASRASANIASHRIQSIGGDTPCTAQGTRRAA